MCACWFSNWPSPHDNLTLHSIYSAPVCFPHPTDESYRPAISSPSDWRQASPSRPRRRRLAHQTMMTTKMMMMMRQRRGEGRWKYCYWICLARGVICVMMTMTRWGWYLCLSLEIFSMRRPRGHNICRS